LLVLGKVVIVLLELPLANYVFVAALFLDLVAYAGYIRRMSVRVDGLAIASRGGLC
jgi:hypothetical protein